MRITVLICRLIIFLSQFSNLSIWGCAIFIWQGTLDTLECVWRSHLLQLLSFPIFPYLRCNLTHKNLTKYRSFKACDQRFRSIQDWPCSMVENMFTGKIQPHSTWDFFHKRATDWKKETWSNFQTRYQRNPQLKT